ncbi:hypothetical protein I3842_Q067000 [Carya illinoinensis]|uniref:Uncharacterized protein n=1 Tax=Carya illinoinensis TaxID=32201 RepID=A0A922A3J8_CARIL|nr:hypothetical protein I3842_Q067000 [Carya illinoinensis]
MAGNSMRSIFVSLFVFAVILSPLMVRCDAARFTQELPDPYVLLVSAAHCTSWVLLPVLRHSGQETV